MQDNRKKLNFHFFLLRKKMRQLFSALFESLRMHSSQVVLSVPALGHYPTSFHMHSPVSPLLTFFLCFSVLFQSCCSHVQVFGKILVHEFPIFYSHTESLNGTCSLRAPILFCGDVPALKNETTNKQTSLNHVSI